MNTRLFDSIVYVTVCLSVSLVVGYLAIEPPVEEVAAVPALEIEVTPLAHNTENPMDVTGDGIVASNDAQLIMETLRIHREALPLPVEKLTNPTPFVDVNGDGFLSEKDAQAVILHLNRINTTSRRPA